MSHLHIREHQLIDRVAPSQVAAAVGLLETMLNPVSRAIANAPYDDEPESRNLLNITWGWHLTLRAVGGNGEVLTIHARLGPSSSDYNSVFRGSAVRCRRLQRHQPVLHVVTQRVPVECGRIAVGIIACASSFGERYRLPRKFRDPSSWDNVIPAKQQEAKRMHASEVEGNITGKGSGRNSSNLRSKRRPH